MARAPFILAAAALAGGAGLQPEQPELRRVDPGYEDFSPIALSRRLEPVDNRVTLFAEDVYEGVRTDRFGAEERIYMRRYGGMTVVFPQSTYVPTVEGERPTIPPGAIFYLGPAEDVLGSGPPAPAPTGPARQNLRQDLSADPSLSGAAGPVPVPTAGPTVQQSIFTSEVYRRRRMASLLAQAARAELGRPVP